MRRLVILLDATLLFTALAILIIDYKIKEDIINQAKAVQAMMDAQKTMLGVFDGQGNETADNVPSSVPSGVLLRGDADNAAMAVQDSAEKSATRSERAARNRPAKRSAGNPDKGISGQSEPLGS